MTSAHRNRPLPHGTRVEIAGVRGVFTVVGDAGDGAAKLRDAAGNPAGAEWSRLRPLSPPAAAGAARRPAGAPPPARRRTGKRAPGGAALKRRGGRP